MTVFSMLVPKNTNRNTLSKKTIIIIIIVLKLKARDRACSTEKTRHVDKEDKKPMKWWSTQILNRIQRLIEKEKSNAQAFIWRYKKAYLKNKLKGFEDSYKGKEIRNQGWSGDDTEEDNEMRKRTKQTFLNQQKMKFRK